MEFCKWIRWIAAGLGGVITWVCGPLDSMLEVLLIMIAMDYATGLICGMVQKRLDSQTGFVGIARKVFILALVGVVKPSLPKPPKQIIATRARTVFNRRGRCMIRRTVRGKRIK